MKEYTRTNQNVENAIQLWLNAFPLDEMRDSFIIDVAEKYRNNMIDFSTAKDAILTTKISIIDKWIHENETISNTLLS